MKTLTKYSKRQIENIGSLLKQYAEDTENPNLSGFIASHTYAGKPITKRFLQDREEYAYLLEWMRAKEESWLRNQKRDIFAMFLLKQPEYGYVNDDKGKTEVNVTFTNTIPRPNRKQIKGS